MLKGADSKPKKSLTTRLIKPILGLSNKIHEIVLRIPGMINGISDMTTKSFFSGVFVRSLTQARNVPIKKVSVQVPRP